MHYLPPCTLQYVCFDNLIEQFFWYSSDIHRILRLPLQLTLRMRRASRSSSLFFACCMALLYDLPDNDRIMRFRTRRKASSKYWSIRVRTSSSVLRMLHFLNSNTPTESSTHLHFSDILRLRMNSIFSASKLHKGFDTLLRPVFENQRSVLYIGFPFPKCTPLIIQYAVLSSQIPCFKK